MKHLGVYTVEDAVEAIGFGQFQIVVTIFAGMIWLSDAMEVMLLAVLSPILKCDWDLAPWQQALLTSIVFAGFLLGSLVWGFLADSVGRKISLLIIGFFVFTFGLLSAASPSYEWLLFLRFIVGFAIGGSSQSVTYYIEFLSLKLRGLCVVLLALWWAIGSILAAVLALAVMPNIPHPLNWRVYLGLCAIPIGVVTALFIFMPESPRYYVSKGKIEKGEKVIRWIAWFNRKKPPSGRLVSQEEKERLEAEFEKNADKLDTDIKESSLFDGNDDGVTDEVDSSENKPLLQKEPSSSPPSSPPPDNNIHSSPSSLTITRIDRYKKAIAENIKDYVKGIISLFTAKGWRTTIPLLFIWLGCAWLYYGSVLLTTTILENGYNPACGNVNETTHDFCDNLTASFYVEIVWTSSAEIPGIILSLIIIELIGRKITMAIEFIGAGIFFGLLLVCVSETWLGVFLFSARGLSIGVFQAVYVYTPEVYPTKHRGAVVGIMASASRVGAIITPFIAQTLYHTNDKATLIMYLSSCVLLTILALLLPIETKGRSLKDT